DEVEAPITEGDVLGHLVYQMDGQEIGRVEILAAQNVEEAGFFDYWKKVWKNVVL
ncbi:MAG: D-alanyl-D-alanine carboxypeptidase, partial [Lachnospiraceae bacterium]|nr:D-alanyl-D-alanine carboxypeptidase [Lachnospiraceae bacterium]